MSLKYRQNISKIFLFFNISILLVLYLTQPGYSTIWHETNEGIGLYDYIELNSSLNGTYIHYGVDWAGWNRSEVAVGINGFWANYTGNWVHDAGLNKHLSTGVLDYGWHGAGWAAGSSLTYYCKIDDNAFDPWNQEQGYTDELALIDVETLPIPSSYIYDNDTRLVLQFSINAGSNAGRELNRLWVENTGSLEEINDIPNNGIYLYYENGTSFSFDGNEKSAVLYGNYNTNPANNKQWGHDALNISIPSDGTNKLYCYIVINRFSVGVTRGRTAKFKIMNDGMSLDGYGLNQPGFVRIDAQENPDELTLSSDTPRIVVNGDSTDWFGSNVVNWDADKNQGIPNISSQTCTATAGGKLFWKDATGNGPMSGGTGDVSDKDDYSGQNADNWDLDFFSMVGDTDNLYFLIKFADINLSENDLMIQIPIKYSDAGDTQKILLGKFGEQNIDSTYLVPKTYWQNLIVISTDSPAIRIFNGKTGFSVDTGVYGKVIINEDENFIEAAVPKSYLGGASEYFNDTVYMALAVFQENTVPNGFVKAYHDGGSSDSIPEVVDCISQKSATFRGDLQDSDLFEFTSFYDLILNTYLKVEFTDNTSLRGNIEKVEVYSGKTVDGLSSEYSDADLMEIRENSKLYMGYDNTYFFFCLSDISGFTTDNDTWIGIAVDIDGGSGGQDSGPVINGWPVWPRGFKPDYFVQLDNIINSRCWLYDGTGANWAAAVQKSNNIAGWAYAYQNCVEIQIPRYDVGAPTENDKISFMIFTSNDAVSKNIHLSYPLSNPVNSDSIFLGGYYYTNTDFEITKPNSAVDTTAPTFEITSITAPDSASALGSLNSSSLYPNFYRGDSLTVFTAGFTVSDPASSVNSSGVGDSVWIWNSSNNSEDTAGYYTANPVSVTGVSTSSSDTVFFSITVYDKYGNKSADTVYIVMDSTNPDSIEIICPENGAETLGTNSIIKFDWVDSYDTHSGIKKYYIQISSSPAFSSNLFEGYTLNTASETSYNFAYKTYTSYYWRYYALDNSGNTSGWSNTNSFNYYLFTEVNTSFVNVTNGAVSSADYDNDGDLDLVITGTTTGAAGGAVSKIYRNDGSGIFTDINAGLTGVYNYGSAAWGDYDNDGDPDLIIGGLNSSGSETAVLYRNDNGTFTVINAGITGLAYNSYNWFDYDNDGDLDIFSIGSSPAATGFITRAYRNDGNNTFTNVGNCGVTNFDEGSFDFSDYNNDGWVDIAVNGYNGVRVAAIFRNNKNGTFTDIAAGIETMHSGSIVWADYNNDGYSDILEVGNNGGGPVSRLYKNNGNNTFTLKSVTGLVSGTGHGTKWADFDNDGYIDFLITEGTGANANIYKNTGNDSFINTNSNISGITGTGSCWFDYDNDGDLDLMISGDTDATAGFSIKTKLYRNNTATIINQRPAAPSLTTSNNTVFSSDTITFQWADITTDSTPAPAIGYNLRIGTSAGGCQVIGVDTNSNHFSGNTFFGNVYGGTTAYIFGLPGGIYYWSVQAVDGGMMKSEWAAERTFIMTPRIKITSVSTGYETCVQTIYISGTTNGTSSGDTVKLYVNSICCTSLILSSPNGSWSGTVLLTGMGDSVSAELTYRINKNDCDTIAIHYYTGPWYVNDSSTANDSFTYSAGSDTSGSGSKNFPFASITKALFFAKSGDTVYIDAGTYYRNNINDTFIAQIDTDYLTITGIDSNISIINTDSPVSGNYVFLAIDRHHINIQNLKILNSYYGIYYKNTDTSVLQNIHFDSNAYSSLYTLYNSGSDYCDSLTITNCFIEKSWYALYISYTNDIKIINNYFHDNYSSGINASYSNLITIQNNYFDGALNADYGISLGSSSNSCSVLQNTFINHTSNVLNINAGDTIIINGNIINGGSQGIRMASSSKRGYEITENIISNATGYGIYCQPGATVEMLISKNTISFTPTGIYSMINQYINIRNNFITNSTNYGMNILLAAGNAFEQNTFDSSGQYALYITSGAAVPVSSTRNNYLKGFSVNDSGVFNNYNNYIDLSYSFWGTTDSNVIYNKMGGNYGDSIIYLPFRTSIIDTASGADTVAPYPPDFILCDTSLISQVVLKWSKPSFDEDSGILTGLSGYRLYRCDHSDTNDWEHYLIAVINDENDTDYIDTDLSESNENYYYRVVAFDSHYTNGTNFQNRSWYSSILKTSTITNSVPSCTISIPSDGETYGQNVSCTFVISDPDDNKCTLTVIQYSKDGGVTWIDAKIISGDTDNLSSDSVGKTYSFIWNSYADLPDTLIQIIKFRIIVFDGKDTGSADTTLNFCIDNIKPDSPSGLYAVADVAIPDTGVILCWTKTQNADEAGYNIYRDTTGLGNYLKINLTIITDTFYFDTSAIQGETHYYAVATVDSYGNESIKTDSVSAANVLIKKYIQSVKINSYDTDVKPGATVTYYIEYLNNGFAPAFEVVIYDTLVSEIVYKVSTADSVSGNTSQISFSNDNTSTWIYSPVGSVDSNVTNIRFSIIGSVPPKYDWPCSGCLKYGTVIK